ncbi:uncharacterized [Tachysurus ichikawai]
MRCVRFLTCSKKNRAVHYSDSAWNLARHSNPVASTSSLLEPRIYVSSHASAHEQLGVLGRSGSSMLPYLIIHSSVKQEDVETEKSRGSAVCF